MEHIDDAPTPDQTPGQAHGPTHDPTPVPTPLEGTGHRPGRDRPGEDGPPGERAEAPAAVAEPPPRMLVRTPEDLLASVPVVLGFVPERSVVMVTLGTGHGPHARVDLVEGEHLAAAHALVEPALRHGVPRVALIVYGPLEEADEAAPVLGAVFAEAGVEVAALVAADGKRWRSWSATGSSVGTRLPRDYDPLSHRFVAAAVLAGRVVLNSREEVAEGLRPTPVLVTEVARHREAVEAEEPWDADTVARTLRRTVERGRTPTPLQVARLRRAVADPAVRDAAWGWVPREQARPHVDLWRHVVRSCAPGEAVVPGAVLAFHAWLAGDGALAWCALDRAGEAGGRTSLAALVADLLEAAVTPGTWNPVEPPLGPGTGSGTGSGTVARAQSGRGSRTRGKDGARGNGSDARDGGAVVAEVVQLRARRRPGA